jgi:hypothetical protein
MFPIKAKTVLPIQHIVLHGIAIRGQLGPMTVWVSRPDCIPDESGNYHFRLLADDWIKIYEKRHESSPHELCLLDLEDQPIVLWPGQVRAVYVHSTLPGDEGLVYDNTHPDDARAARPRHEDAWLRVASGKAHLCPEPFGQVPIWGWGNAWRDHREFVGRLHYGIRYQLWHPDKHVWFGPRYRAAVRTLLLMQRRCTETAKTESSIWSMLPDECIYYIAHLCPWDWFGDTPTLLQQDHDRRKQARLQPATAASALSTEATAKPARRTLVPCPPVRGEESDNVYYDAAEELDDSERSWNNHADDPHLATSQGDYMDLSRSDHNMEVIIEGINENAAKDGYGSDADADVDDDEEEDDDDEASNTSAWERANGYRADSNVFRYQDPDWQGEGEPRTVATANGAEAGGAPAWFRGHHRGDVLQALQQSNDNRAVSTTSMDHENGMDANC